VSPVNVIYVAYQVIVVVGTVVHWLVAGPRTGRRFAEVLLLWLFVVDVGVAGLMGFYAHTAMAAETAASIGWAPGSPFQFEVAVANLAFGVLGILCVWLRGLWWWATAVGISVFLLGAAYGHVQQIVEAGNRSPGNAGAVLYADILIPLVLLALLAGRRWLARSDR